MSLESWAGGLKRQTLIVYYAARDPRLPWAVRLIALMVAAYALSPIDLIPDFIPVLGLIDDLILVPLGIALVIRLTPPEVIAHARERAGASGRPVSRVAAGCVIVVWLLLAAALLAWVLSG
ncbi:MAG: YkvA family protein [Burkholderiales bacterium]|nr:YkvA family protein [Burkholderiales bacterium]